MGTDASRTLRAGEVVLLRRTEGDSFLVSLSPDPVLVPGIGVFDLAPAIGKPEGWPLSMGSRTYRVLRPSLRDLVARMRRRAQIITPKDAQHLLYLTGVGPGSRVVEAGSGSGGLTLFLAWAVGPSGHVVSYDRRPEHQAVARENLTAAGLLPRVEFKEADVAVHGFEETDVDAVFLDVPEPWTVLEAAWTSLRPGGYLALYVPTYNQLERGVRALRERGFQEVSALELLERGLHVGEGGTRPEFEVLGHTGFLASARKIPPAPGGPGEGTP